MIMKKSNKQEVKVTYEPEADVLMWEMSGKPIDSAKEVGNMIVHFTKDNSPVLIELLDASKFLSHARRIVTRHALRSVRHPVLVSRA